MQEKKCFFVGIETFCTFAEVKRYRYEYASINCYIITKHFGIIELLTLPSSSSRFICLFAKDILHS